MNTINLGTEWQRLRLPQDIQNLLMQSPGCTFPSSRQDLLELALQGQKDGITEIAYDIPGQGRIVEATVTRCKNALVVNYPDPQMRRRDPDCMVVADDQQTDKARYSDRFGESFDRIRDETLAWLAQQKLIVMAISLGAFDPKSGQGGLLVAPANAGFFAAGLADLQGLIPANQIPENFKVRTTIYLAPPFRHTHFEGKQLVVHKRRSETHEVFAYNLYPGPSAKKGVYGVLLSLGETGEWPTLHASTVEVVTPYDNVTTIMHEGASGGGKSEMLEFAHRESDGRLQIGKNVLDGQTRHMVLTQNCRLRPVTDDMAMCRPNNQNKDGHLVAQDAEQAWFIRINHIEHYGTDPHMEEMTIHAKEPLIMFNIQATPHSTCLIWEHIEDSPGVPCPNPRVIMPRQLVPDHVEGAVRVMLRSFGVRTPPCTRENPSFGIMGFLHLLPASLAWLWRLVAPRGYANPSITGSSDMASEGVGSYWPFATGRVVDHANLLLRQIQTTPKVRYVLIPNQHVGAWEVSFMPQWISREYLARRGVAGFHCHQVQPARCNLLGYTPRTMQIDGASLPQWLLQPELQSEIGTDGYDAGAAQLRDFFEKTLQEFLHPDLDPLGKEIINCCLNGGTHEDYDRLLYPAIEPDHLDSLDNLWQS